MAHPSQSNRPSFVRSLAGHNSYPIIPDSFFTAHLEGLNDVTKLKLTSDASDIYRTWEVKLKGRIFAGGWEDFSAAHCLRDDDVLVFRYDGEMVFHVTPSGRSFSQIHCISSSSGDDDNADNDDDDEDDAIDGDETGEDDSDLKKESRLKAESSSSENSLSCRRDSFQPTPRSNGYYLDSKHFRSFSRHFSRTNGCLHKRMCKIDLMNLSGKSWALLLRHNNITGQYFIRGGWRKFCRANELKPGSFYRFKLVRNGTRPLLRLCSEINSEGNCSKANGKENVSEMHTREGESALMKQNKFLTVTYKHYMLKSGNFCLPRQFVRKNGIKEREKITLVDKNGGKWPSYVAFAKGRGDFYMSKGWRRFCVANRLKTGETFTLEFVRGEGTTPMLKFCSKAKVKIKQAPLGGPKRTVQASRDETEEAHEETNTRFQKRARVSAEEGPSRRTLASNESSADPKNLQRKQLLQPCSISDHVTKLKQSIVVALTGVRRIRSELEIKEQHLEASLKEINALGEKVSEINKILE